jgi:TP901 family phage tail tape measure protein
VTLGELVVRLRADVSQFDPAIGRAVASLGRLDAAGRKAGEGFSKPFAALGLLGAVAAKQAMDFEQAFARVDRVFDRSTGSVSKLRQGILNLSTTIPVAATELSEMAEMGAQMGIEGHDNLLKFTEVVARLGAVADMAGQDAAMMIARIGQVNHIDPGQYDRLASAVLSVSSKFNATTPEVLRMTLQMQGLGAQAGLSATDMLGLAAAVSSSGIRIESGGTAIGRMARDVSQATIEGGQKLAEFARIAGMSADQFRQAWSEDAGSAFAKVFEGLSKEGDNLFHTLDKLGWQNIRVGSTAGALAKSFDQVARGMSEARTGFAENNELTRQSTIIFSTTRAQLTLMIEKFKTLGIEFGSNFLPLVAGVGRALMGLADILLIVTRVFNQLPETVRTFTAALMVGGVAMRTFGLTIGGSLIPALGAFVGMIGTAATAIGAALVPAFAAGAGTAAALTSALFIAIPAVVAVGGAAYYLTGAWLEHTETGQGVIAFYADLITKMKEVAGLQKSKAELERQDLVDPATGLVKGAGPQEKRPTGKPGTPTKGGGAGLDEDQQKRYNEALRDTESQLRVLGAQNSSTYAGMMAEIDADIAKRLSQEIAVGSLRDKIIAVGEAQRAAATERFIVDNLGPGLEQAQRGANDLVKAFDLMSARGGLSNEQLLHMGQAAIAFGDAGASIDAKLEPAIARVRELARTQEELDEFRQLMQETARINGLLGPSVEEATNAFLELGASVEAHGGVQGLTNDQLEQYIEKLNDIPDDVVGKVEDLNAALAEQTQRLTDTQGVNYTPPISEQLAKYDGDTYEAKIASASAAINSAKAATTDWGTAIRQINETFELMGISAEEGIGRVIAVFASSMSVGQDLDKAFGGLTQTMDAQRAIWGDDLDVMGTAMDNLSKVDWAGFVNGIMQAGAAFMEATDSASAFQRVVGGAMVGSQVGGSIGRIFGEQGEAIGRAAGAIIGGIAGFFRTPAWVNAGREAGRVLGVEVSEELARAIEATATELDLDYAEAALLHITDAIEETGRSAAEFGVQIQHLLTGVADGTIPAAEGLEQINDLWGQLADDAAEHGGNASAAMIGMISTMRALGMETQEMKDWVVSNLEQAAAAFDDLWSASQTASKAIWERDKDGNVRTDANGNRIQARDENGKRRWEERTVGTTGGLDVNTQELANAQATIFSATFFAMVKEKGLMAAIDAMGESFTQLSAIFDQMGFDKALLAPMQELFALGDNEMFRGAAEGAQALANAMQGLANAGYMNIATFDAFGTSAEAAYNQAYQAAVESGMGQEAAQRAAIQAILPLLAQIKTAQEQYGFTIDEATQALINQAEAAGFSFPTDPVRAMTDALLELINTLRELHNMPPYVPVSGGAPHAPAGGGPASGGGDYESPDYGQGPDEHHALGFFDKSLKKDKIMKVHQGEGVLVQPGGFGDTGPGINGNTAVQYAPSVSISVTGSEGADPEAIARALDVVLRDNVASVATRVREISRA